MALPNLTVVARASVWEDSHLTLMARLQVESNNNLTPAVQADFSTITWKVYDGATLIGSGSLTVAAVVYNTLQTGTIWGVDETGFNFKTTLANTNFPEGSKVYTVELTGTLVSGVVFHWGYEAQTLGRAGS